MRVQDVMLMLHKECIIIIAPFDDFNDNTTRKKYVIVAKICDDVMDFQYRDTAKKISGLNENSIFRIFKVPHSLSDFI